MYFLILRPQNKRRREAAQLQSQVGIGDEVQTVGGLYGTIVSVDDETVTIEGSPGVHLRYARGAVARVIKSNQVESEDDGNSDASKTIEQG